jgi:hypothetical protein
MEAQVFYYKAGQRQPDPKAGDVGLVRSPFFYSRVIRAGQFLSGDRGYAFYNHAWVTRFDSGEIVESRGEGPVGGHIERFDGYPYAIIRLPLDDAGQARGDEFLSRVLVDTNYDWLSIAGAAPYVLSGGRLGLARPGAAYICSALAAEYLVRSRNHYFARRHAVFQWPSSIAREFGAKDPQ